MMAKVAAAGATYIRSGMDWAAIQPNGQGTAYAWDTYDARVNLALQYGLSFVAVVGTAPKWAVDPNNTNLQMPPLSQYTADFQAFVTAVVQRYQGKIHHYEFDNEPDGFGWYPSQPPASAYKPWLQTFYNAVKAVDPTAWVSTGGVDNLQGGLTFIENLYGSGGQPYFDAVAAHPYSPNNGPFDSAGVQSLHDFMHNNGDFFKPIWLTEYGWSLDPADPYHIDPATQQTRLQQALDFLANTSNNYVTIATFQIIADIYGPNGMNTVMGLLDQYLDSMVRTAPAYGTFQGYSKPTT